MSHARIAFDIIIPELYIHWVQAAALATRVNRWGTKNILEEKTTIIS